MLERISALITYCIALLMAKIGHFSLQDTATIVGMVLGVVMCLINLGKLLINWNYRRKTFQLLADGKISKGDYDAANR